ncbi:hypothetical protein [Rhodovulum sulfidophilum]|uniref:Uncharacterized protein n=1 Tax=Rhodovulum sulfidophilum TaxID=35806 RepID=A0ABS1RQQ0_RHOSU|nr:hypothetical protein [Rhodovulum sulfidophilum]MBL3608217.1 hypothetical protein [Rhodovulum sulfidophilum]MCE8456302.1 hypothetical protein [Rhodovulum sulfidophilum]
MADTLSLHIKSDGVDMGFYDQHGRRVEGVTTLEARMEVDGLTHITMTVVSGTPARKGEKDEAHVRLHWI